MPDKAQEHITVTAKEIRALRKVFPDTNPVSLSMASLP